MKHFRILVCLAALCALLFAVAAMGQEGAPAQEQQPRRPMMQTPQERLDAMAKELNLTDAQKDKIKPILENEQKQMQDLRADQSMSREDRMAKMREIRTKSSDDIKAVLNDEQKKKFEEMNQRRGPGGPRPQGPPPGL